MVSLDDCYIDGMAAREHLRNVHDHFTTEKQHQANLMDDTWTTSVGMRLKTLLKSWENAARMDR